MIDESIAKEPNVAGLYGPRIQLMGMELDAITESDCNHAVMQALDAGKGGVVVTANLDHLRRFELDPLYRRIARHAEIVVADGAPLIWASAIQNTPLPERVAGSDLIWSMSRAAAEHGRSVFLFGGNPGTAESAARVLQQHHPSLRIAGTTCPDFGFEVDENAMNAVREILIKAAPDIVYVALGSPKQEYVIDQLKASLPNAWWMGVGISFSFISGDVDRAPAWMQQLGVEWIHRLSQEPSRLARRYLIDGVPFGLRLMRSAATKRLFG